MTDINDLITIGYEKLVKENVKEACETWLQAWERIKIAIGEENYKSIEEIDENFEGLESLSNWAQDLEMELENAGVEDEKFFNYRLNYCREFYMLLEESEEFTVMSMKLAEAESNFELGNIEKSENLFENCAKEYEDSIWPFLKWGDVYWLSYILRKRNNLMNLNKALEIYKNGLGRNHHEEYILEDRIRDVENIINK